MQHATRHREHSQRHDGADDSLSASDSGPGSNGPTDRKSNEQGEGGRPVNLVSPDKDGHGRGCE